MSLAINLRYEVENIDIAGANGALYYHATGPWRYWAGLLRTADGRWFGDEADRGFDFAWREITPSLAADWWRANAPDRLMPPELRDDLGGASRPPEGEPGARPQGDPASRAVAAAYALRKAGRPVSVRAACKAARVDRNHLAKRHPETVKLIEQLAEPDRAPLRGAIDRRAGNLDAWDEG